MLHRAMLARALAGFGVAIAMTALAQEPRTLRLDIDSGDVRAPRSAEPDIVFSTPVHCPGASWVRVKFGPSTLAGDAAAAGATIRITGQEDGAVQFLTAESLKRWGFTSAYFNGDRVTVDLIGFPGSGPSRVRIEGAEAGVAGAGAGTLCGDPGEPSGDSAVGRVLPEGRTAFLINDANRMLLSSGAVGAGSVVQFNIPGANPDGSLRHPSPMDQYPVDAGSVQHAAGWAYFGVFPNANTGLTPAQVQNSYHRLALAVPAQGEGARVVGQTSASDAGDYTVEDHTLVHAARAADLGAPVIGASGEVLAIHTASACDSPSGRSTAVSIDHPALRRALANPRGVCASGSAAPANGTLFGVGDAGNNFGALSGTGQLSALAQLAPSMQGLAYVPAKDHFVAIDSVRGLYTISPSGTVVFEGTITGTTQTFNGLAYDPGAERLFTVAQATGQLFRIDQRTMSAAPVGPAHGGNIGAVDFDAEGRVLYAIDDAPEGSRLVRISTTDGSHHVVGELGGGIADCNGLAWNPADGLLYAINAGNQHLLAISPRTGTATSLGVSNGVFGSAFGLAARPRATGNCNPDFDGDGDPGTDADVEAFFRAMAGVACPTCGSTDIDGDGEAATDFDVEAFFRAMAGLPC